VNVTATLLSPSPISKLPLVLGEGKVRESRRIGIWRFPERFCYVDAAASIVEKTLRVAIEIPKKEDKP
jgi:hypothetical protein